MYKILISIKLVCQPIVTLIALAHMHLYKVGAPFESPDKWILDSGEMEIITVLPLFFTYILFHALLLPLSFASTKYPAVL